VPNRSREVIAVAVAAKRVASTVGESFCVGRGCYHADPAGPPVMGAVGRLWLLEGRGEDREPEEVSA
jgi:hypothetical protein